MTESAPDSLRASDDARLESAMYTLYYSPGRAGLAIHWMLIELGVPFEARLVDFSTMAHKRADYLWLNPDGMVPTLVIDGRPHAECAALALMLAERHPEGGLEVPPGAPERSDYLQWMFYFANTLQPLYRAWFYTDEVGGVESAESVKARARARIEKVWDRVDARLQEAPYIAGAKRTAVDFQAFMLMRWSRDMPKPADRWDAIADCLERMKAMRSFGLVHEREGLDIWPAARGEAANGGTT
jgi:glutathione S-transferase